jgi:hypothetical protein
MKFNSQLPTFRRNTRFTRFSHSLLLAGVALTLTAVLPIKAAEPDAPPSYGELATRLLCGPLEEIERGLTNFTSATLPHEARELRKLMGRFRNKLDLFAFAYPAGPGDDLFLKLREDIDKGYERMGDFKDLFDAQRIELAKYDPEKDRWSAGIRPEAVRYADHQKLQSRRDKVLKWQEKFMEAGRLARYRAYVCAPDGQKFHARPAKDLSRFFWGSEEGLMPRAELSGVDNFRWLAAEMLARAHRDHPAVMELRDLEGATAEKFHDFRKRVRAVVRIAEDIDIVPAGNRRAGELNKLMDELDDSFGDLNDKIVDLGLAVESGNSTKAGKLRGEIAADWTRLQQWQTTQNIAAALNEYAGLLRSLMPPDR